MEGTSFEDIFTKDLTLKQELNLKQAPDRIALIEDEIWIIMRDGDEVRIFKQAETGKIIYDRSIQVHDNTQTSWGAVFKTTYNVRGVTMEANGLIVPACKGIHYSPEEDKLVLGLVEIDRNGLITSIIAEGESEDVASDGENIYALSGTHTEEDKDKIIEHCSINVLKYIASDKHWMHINSIYLKDSFSTLSVRGPIITLGDAITWFDQDTEKKYRVDKDFTGTVSGSDKARNVLINTGRELCLLKPDKTIVKKELPGEFDYICAATANNKGHLFAITANGFPSKHTLNVFTY